MATPQELAKMVIEEINKHGWVQGTLGPEWGQPGPRCLVGHIRNLTQTNADEEDKLIKIIGQKTGYGLIAIWNDVHGRTKEDVINLLQSIVDEAPTSSQQQGSKTDQAG